MDRLFPAPTPDIDVATAYADASRHRHDGRPWVAMSMISSIDGATAIEGRSGGLGGAGDKAVFSAMRALADVIVVGAATVRAEGYGPPRKAGQRIAVVSSRGGFDWDQPLWTSGAGLLVTTDAAPAAPVETIRAGDTAVDLGAALRQISGEVVVAEGGPHLNGQLLAAGLVDELCVTLAPSAVAGDSARIATGTQATPESARELRLMHVLHDNGYLFCRYVRT